MEFRLLVEEPLPQDKPSFSLEGRAWTLSQPIDLERDSDVPAFACISYRWGTAREPNALLAGQVMSARALPSLAAAMRVERRAAFWMDTFCVPAAGAARQATLERMGYIYSRAAEVVIVLGEATFAAIQELVGSGSLSEPGLRLLDGDDWVRSVWTYQEIVNGAQIRFVSERPGAAAIECSTFFSQFGYALSRWRAAAGLSNFALARAFPNLDALEMVMADWQTAGYAARSALSVFTGMARKHDPSPDNYLYASLGALTTSPEELSWGTGPDLASKIMLICEKKRDFSFIFTAAPRDTNPRRRWRPSATPVHRIGNVMPPVLRPILVWHSWGEAQDGELTEDGLLLHGMTLMEAGPALTDPARQFLAKWIEQPVVLDADVDTVADGVFEILQVCDFTGHPKPIDVGEGLVFTSENVSDCKILQVVISTQIRWAMGAPGLVKVQDSGGERYVTCAFVGSIARLQGDGESVLL